MSRDSCFNKQHYCVATTVGKDERYFLRQSMGMVWVFPPILTIPAKSRQSWTRLVH
jgi:hypothetical protein